MLIAACGARNGEPDAGGEHLDDGGVGEEPLPPLPGAPAGLRITLVDGQPRLEWDPVEGASTYHVYFAASPGVSPGTAAVVRGVASPFDDVGRAPGSTWHYVVTAGNRAGESPPSSEVSITLPVESVPAAPAGVVAQAGDSEVLVSWDGSSGAKSYNLYWSTSSGVTVSAANRVSGVTSPFRHLGRANGRPYYYAVAAANGAGESALSEEVSATPRLGPPGAPASVYAVPGAGQNQLWWTAVPGATGHRVYWSTTAGVTPATGTRIEVGESPYVHVGLTNGTRVYYVVTAVTAGGEGPPSAEVSATPEAPPPTGLTLTALTGSIRLAWSTSGRAGITGHNIYWRTTPGVTPANGTKIATTALTYTHGALANGTRYYYVLTANSAGGESLPTAEASAVPVRPAPAKPTLSVGNSQLQLSWTAQTGAVSYNLYWSTTAGVDVATASKLTGVTSPYAHTGLTNGTTYYYRLVSVGSAGDESLPSAEASGSPRIGAPTGLTAVGGDSQVTVSWDPVPGATSYDLYWDLGSVSPSSGTLVANATSPFVHTGLTNGQEYAYTVIAKDVATSSVTPSAVLATPLPPPPAGPPTNVQLSVGAAQATLSWTLPADATSAHIYWSNAPGVTPSTGNRLGGVSSPFTHERLTMGSAYYYVVTGANMGGEGPPSAEVSGTIPITPLLAPSGLTIAARHRAAVLQWAMVSGAATYNLYWSTSPGVTTATGTLVSGNETTTFIHAPLNVGTTYYYVVTAVNGAFEGPASSEASLTAADVPGSITAGEEFSAARKGDGTVWAFGSNYYGTLGTDAGSSSITPVQVTTASLAPLADIAQLASGDDHALALADGGTAWSWGRNSYGELGIGTTSTKSDRAVQVLASAGVPFNDVQAIAGGDSFSLAVRNDGTVWSWGLGLSGRLGRGTSTANRSYPGAVVNGSGTQLNDAWAVAAGRQHGVALRRDGTVWAWGGNSSGQLCDGSFASKTSAVQMLQAPGTPLGGIVAVAAGYAHTLLLRRDGRVLACGNNYSGALGDGTSDDRAYPVLVLASAGTPLEGVLGISASEHSMAVRGDGTAWAWGYNYYGAVGDGSTTDRFRPVQVMVSSSVPLAGVASVEAGAEHSLAFGLNGSFHAWGWNLDGELGAPSSDTCNGVVCAWFAQPVTSF